MLDWRLEAMLHGFGIRFGFQIWVWTFLSGLCQWWCLGMLLIRFAFGIQENCYKLSLLMRFGIGLLLFQFFSYIGRRLLSIRHINLHRVYMVDHTTGYIGIIFFFCSVISSYTFLIAWLTIDVLFGAVLHLAMVLLGCSYIALLLLVLFQLLLNLLQFLLLHISVIYTPFQFNIIVAFPKKKKDLKMDTL